MISQNTLNWALIWIHCSHLLDYDTDDYGLFKAKGESQETKGAKEILDSTITKIDTPVDLMKTQTIDETELGNQLAQLRAAAAADWLID